MALNINTNITNNLDGYLLDAKNVKGTYVVVSNYSELANLPSACVVEGTLAYCQYATVYEATDYQDGFYIYKNSSWTVYPMGIGRVVFDKYNQTNFDITQTYSWAYNDSDVSNNFTAIATMAVNGGLLQINFNDDAFLFNYSGISQTNKSSVSMVVIYDNKQYIATIVVNNTDLSNVFVLSFSEIQGGSSQPTIPERFSLAYNLVVNINQEQFANGSWTGSNSDNIRTFQYNGSNADETKAKELVEFLTGVPVLDEYNATKPTPCFVFCTQSNICWKLQWDSSLLHAYKVENFPFVVKKKYYNFMLNDSDGVNSLSLQINIPYEAMQDVYNEINQALSSNISTPQEVIGVYDMLKADNISSQAFGMLVQLFTGLAQVCFFNNLNNLVNDGDIYSKISGMTIIGILYGGNTALFSDTLTSNKISFTSNSTLTINEYDNDRLNSI